MTTTHSAILVCYSLLSFVAMGCTPTAPTPEAEAKAIVKAALDSWNLGGSSSEFPESQKNVERFFDIDWVGMKVLLRYEIKGVTKDTSGLGGFKVIAVLVFQSKGGTEITEQRTYKVYPALTEGKWEVSSS